jgi:spermidine synthase
VEPLHEEHRGQAGGGVTRVSRVSVAALLFGSGLSALVYQIAWQREFRLVFGSSTAASAAVLAIFIGGMGAGGLLLGRRADAHPRPLRLYAALELGVAVTAALTPPLLDLSRAAYLRFGGALTLGFAGATALRLALAALVLAAPTLLMGGTLPAAVRGVQSDADPRRRTVGLLYGANTLGAVTGSVLATFWLLERLGTRATLWSACAANAAVALVAMLLSFGDASNPKADPAPEVATSAPAPRAFVLVAAAVVGFAFFLLELVWYRMLGPLLGGSVFTFGLILAVALAGIGAGGLAYARFGEGRPATLRGFALTCLAEALGVAIPFALGDRIALVALALRPEGVVRLVAYLPGWIAVAAIVVLPAAFAAGAQYPMLIALLGSGRRGVGAQVGAAAACNTAGAMAGSLSGGFVLLPLLSATGCWRATAALLTALGLVALVLAARTEGARADPPEGDVPWLPQPRRWLRRALVPLAAVASLACLAAVGPTAAWRHSPIGAGRVDRLVLRSPIEARRWLHDARRGIVWEREGVESSVALDGTDGLAMVVNGKIDGNARGDAATQVMGGLLGALLHPHPRSAMVIGLGTGSTAGWLGAVPSIERVDVAELEGSMLHIASACAPVNEDVRANPKVRIVVGDAREILLTIPARYDVIFSEPSNPYRAGVASLFTREYYRAVASRLEEGGLFLQWLQAYEIDEDTVRAVYATLGAVFPSVETWRLGASDLVLVASARPPLHDAAALGARVNEEPYRRAVAAAWRTEGLAGVLAHHVARPSAAPRLAGGGRVNTDDQNHVEFAFARHVGNFARVDALLESARSRGEDRPELVNGTVTWAAVEEERIMQIAGEGTEPDIPADLPVDLEVRAVAAVNYVAGNLTGALVKWQYQAEAPFGVTELGLVAEGFAERGSDEALPVIERLRAVQPIEADVAQARLRLRQDRRDEATTLLARAFVAHRRDPWPSPPMMRRALDLVIGLTDGAPDLAARLLPSLSEPFAVSSVDGARRLTALWVASQLPDPARCAAAWHDLEPWVPWDNQSLAARRDCYRLAGDARLDRARHDAEDFVACGASPGWLGCL